MGRSVRRLTRRRLSSVARGVYVAVFVWAWMAPAAHAALPEQVMIEPDVGFVDVPIILREASRVDVVFGGGLSCVEFSAAWPAALDAYLRVFDGDGVVVAEDDDGAFHPEENCYAARVSFDAVPGTYIVRFTRYGQTYGLGYVAWGSTYLTPEPETTNVGTSSSTTSSSSTTTEPLPESTTSQPDTTTSLPETTTTEPSPSSTSSLGGQPTSTESQNSLPAPTSTAADSGAVSTVAVTSVPPSTTLTTPATTATTTTTGATSTSIASPTTSSLPNPSVTSTVASSSVAEPATTSGPAPTTTPSTTSSTTTSTTLNPSTTLPPSSVPSPSSTTTVLTVTTTTLPDVTAGLVDGDVTADDVAALAEIDIATLAPDVVAALVDALNDAPDEVREAFEEQVNVFSGLVDSYVPVGSNVTVAERRTIVAVTAAIASPLSPLSAARRNKV